jgi:hypothetical protein
LVLHVAVQHPTMHGALCGGPDALPLAHDDSPRVTKQSQHFLFMFCKGLE